MCDALLIDKRSSTDTCSFDRRDPAKTRIRGLAEEGLVESGSDAVGTMGIRLTRRWPAYSFQHATFAD